MIFQKQVKQASIYQDKIGNSNWERSCHDIDGQKQQNKTWSSERRRKAQDKKNCNDTKEQGKNKHIVMTWAVFNIAISFLLQKSCLVFTHCIVPKASLLCVIFLIFGNSVFSEESYLIFSSLAVGKFWCFWGIICFGFLMIHLSFISIFFLYWDLVCFYDDTFIYYYYYSSIIGTWFGFLMIHALFLFWKPPPQVAEHSCLSWCVSIMRKARFLCLPYYGILRSWLRYMKNNVFVTLRLITRTDTLLPASLMVNLDVYWDHN